MIRLRVREARVEDAGGGLVRLHPDDLVMIGAAVGDLLLITGRRACPARAAAGEEQGVIRMDGSMRADSEATIDSAVEVERTDGEDATAVVCSAFGPAAAAIGRGGLVEPDLKPFLAGRPVVVGSRIPLGRWGRGSRFLVTGVAPAGVVVIGPTTQISIVPADDEGARPACSYEDIGGLKRELQRVREMVELPLRYPALFLRLGIDPPKGLLLSGPPGTGKTLIARTLASEVSAHFIHVNGPEIMHKYYGESEARLREIFEEAEQRAPSIIFLDELDAIAPKRAAVAGEVEKRVVGQLLALMDGIVTRGQVVVIGATNMPDHLDPALRRPGRFDREIVTRVPDEIERLDILRIHTRDMPLASDVDLSALAGITGGFTGADLEILCKEAAMAALRRVWTTLQPDESDRAEGLSVTAVDFDAGLREVEPAATRELRAERPGITFAGAGGLGTIKEELEATLIAPMRRFRQDGRSRGGPQTFLFHGPPGTGKRLLARATAGELGMSVIALEPSIVLSRWPGETERALAEIFRVANHAAPCLLLMEDLDAIAPVRSGEGAGQLSSRLVVKLLREMRDARRTWGLVIIATTDRPELVDPAVIRGFEVSIPFALPALEERAAIFTLKLPQSLSRTDIRALAARSEGMSGEEIEAVCRRAAALASEGDVQPAHVQQALRATISARAA